MSYRTQPCNAVRHALWLGGLLVVLGGLFGMHGLDSHGGAGMDTMAHTVMTVPAHSAASAHDAAFMTTTVASVASEAVGGMTATGHKRTGMGATGMCIAILVLSLLLLILRLYAGQARPLLWLTARPEGSTLVRGREPDPPSLIRLSIQRC